MRKQTKIELKSFTTNIKHYLEGYVNTVNYLKLVGWAFIDKAMIDNTQKFIICKGSQDSFVFDTYRKRRRDVTRHFKAKDLDSSGYEAYIPKSELPSDTYELFLLLIDSDGTQYRVALDKEVIIK